MRKKNNEKKELFELKGFFKKNYPLVIIIGITFLVMTLLSFFNVATSETVMSYKISEYEVGQIADKTIIADRDLVTDEEGGIKITKGDKVTRKGFPITEEIYQKLRLMAETPEYIDFRSFANSVLYFMMLIGLGIFLFSDVILSKKISNKNLIFILVLFVASYGASVFASKLPFFADMFNLPALIPAILCVMFIAVLIGHMEAISFTILLSFAILQGCRFDLIPAIYVFSTSLVALRIVRNLEKRLDFIFASLMMTIINIVFSVILRVIFNYESTVSLLGLFYLGLNGFISGILVLGLLTPLEIMMNTASVFRLMDLSDTNNPLMQRLRIEASGTFNHSMMVASLAETACGEIGANPLLARVGAYYHDIGKLEQPEYFTENNQTGENKHLDINPSLSISIIRQHIKKSVEKTTQMGFPKEVIDIIAEHHGNSVIQYFYNKAKEQDDSVSPENFSYMGTPPTTRESAVVMLADTVEAACHSLDKPTMPRLEKFIHQLITSKYDHGQLDKAPLTFKDLDIIKKSFATVLTGYYHSRIKYQNQKDPDDESKESEGNKNE